MKISDPPFVTADDAILGQSVESPPQTVITEDVYLRVMAVRKGFTAVSCDAILGDDQIYNGVKEILIAQKELDKIYLDKKADIEGLFPNEYVILRSEQGGSAFGKYRHDLGCVILLNGLPKVQDYIHPKNGYQRLLIDAILDKNIKLVTVHSKAGCGKTIVALACALYLVRYEKLYDKVVLSKSIMPVGLKDTIGFLPGSFKEKMSPWLANFLDNMALLEMDDDIFETPDIEVCATMHLRGRSLHGSIIIIDEFQNIEPEVAKTILTRVGESSKIICLGDITQIDNPKLSILNNGLTHVTNKFRSQPLAASVTLVKNERSNLSEIASQIL